jgi:hypothetical protein
VAVTIEAQTLAGEQSVGDHGDGHFGNRLERAVGTNYENCEGGF